MIAVQHLTKTFGSTTAVNNVSFCVKEGETLVLLGTSGSGKTTTLRMLNRLVEATSGRIHINGEDIRRQTPELLRRRMGYVLQGYGLFPHYTVAENISLVPKLLNWPDQKLQRRVDDLLQQLQLPPAQFRNVYPSALSGGQKQRVGLARALAADPPILLMDEPFGALDPLTRSAVRKEFRALDELKKKTIVLVTHDVQEAFEFGDQIALMDGGSLQQSGPPAALLFQPANAFVREFFQNQRLQLEWQSVPVKTLWPQLPDAPATAEKDLDSHQTLWEAAALLVSTGGSLVVYDAETCTAKTFRFTDLQLKIQHQKNVA